MNELGEFSVVSMPVRRTFSVGSREIEYSISVSTRARRPRITVYPGGQVIVTKPMPVTQLALERFMAAHSRWLLATVAKLERREARLLLPSGKRQYVANKEKARRFVRERIQELNRHYGFRVGRISIRNQKSRWGSCSLSGNLNFNFKIIHLPVELADYIVVHELCHLGEMNHSRDFWMLVAKAIPHHKKMRRELKRFSLR